MFMCTPPAHAKLMFREQVTIEDAVVAVSVMECSMQVSEVWTPNNNQGSYCDQIFDNI
jgi:DNA replicative helicase MCM subunit Mcm2 (Cdc46/Mcm family)